MSVVKVAFLKRQQGLYEQFGEYRVLDTPLAESAIAGVAIGAAMVWDAADCRNAIC